MPHQTWVRAGGLFAITLATFAATMGHGFLNYDDNIYVLDNEYVQAGLGWDSLKYAFNTFDSGNWIPLVWLSYLLDATCFGINPTAFHAVNVLLHSLNAALLFVWLERWTGRPGRSFAVAALFAVHPLHVESVAWVAERKDLLSLFFFLLMLIAYEGYTRSLSPWRYALVLVCYTLGLLSKSMLVTAPLLLCLIDRWPARAWEPTDSPAPPLPSRSRARLFFEKVPLLLLALIIGLITIRAQDAGTTSAFTSWDRIPLPYRIGNAIIAYAWYLTKSLVPSGLCLMYSHPMTRLSWPWVALSALLLIAISVFVARERRQHGYLPFGWLWFLIALLPVIGILQVGTQARADRYTYLPQIGLCIAIVWQAEWWLRKLPASIWIGRTALAASVILLALATLRQISYWSDIETLWQHAIAASPENWEAHRQLGTLCMIQSRPDEASDHLQMALRWNPRMVDVHANLGWIDRLRQDWPAARKHYEDALAISAGYETSMQGLVIVLKQQKQIAQAAPYLQRYLQRRPHDLRMRNELGLIYARAGDLPAAYTEFALAAKIDPDDLPTHTNLGLILSQLGRLAEARPHLEAVVAANGADANARVNLSILLENLGLKDEARRHLEAAVKLNPNDRDAREHLNRLN
jgi:Flp pilus assembly protein TadD